MQYYTKTSSELYRATKIQTMSIESANRLSAYHNMIDEYAMRIDSGTMTLSEGITAIRRAF